VVWALARWIHTEGILLLVELAGLGIAYLVGLYLLRLITAEDVAPFVPDRLKAKLTGG